MDQLRVGILGCGKMGKVYARWFSSNPNCIVNSFYNRTRLRAEELAQQYPGSRIYSRWEDLIQSGDDNIIGICTPSNEHLEQFEACVSYGKHVLCEKPMANDILQCQRMLELSHAHKEFTYMIGFQMRFHPVVEKVTQLLPTIGKVFHIDLSFGMYRPEITWRHKIIQGGGVVKELTSHLFDLGYSWCGDYASIQGLNRIIQKGREVEDYSLNIVEFTRGASGYINSNYHDRRSRLILGNLMAQDGQISFSFSSYNPIDSRVTLYTNGEQHPTKIPIDIPSEIDLVYPGHLDSFKQEINYFVECILKARMPEITIADGARAIQLVDASYESTRLDKKIKLPLTSFDRGKLTDCYSFFEG
jgi:predicted dehydrogenase